MIQRLQSVFMALASLSAILLFIFPVAWFYGNEHTIAFFVFQLKEHLPAAQALTGFAYLLPLIALTLVLVILPLFAIFNYKKLSFQYKLMRSNMLLSIVLTAVLLLYYASDISKMSGAEASYETGAFLPVIALAFSYVAMHFIKKDIKLLRSVDRIR